MGDLRNTLNVCARVGSRGAIDHGIFRDSGVLAPDLRAQFILIADWTALVSAREVREKTRE
jgi:hypothetical protein